MNWCACSAGGKAGAAGGGADTAMKLTVALISLILCLPAAPAVGDDNAGTGPAVSQREKQGVAENAPVSGSMQRRVQKDGVELSADINVSDITLADRVTLTVTLASPPGTETTLRDLGEHPGGFTVVNEWEDPETIDSQGRLVAVKHFLLEPYLPGDYRIPAVIVNYSDPAGGKSGQLRCEGLNVHVRSLINDQPGKKDAADAESADDIREIIVPPSGSHLLPVVVLLLILLLVVAGYLLYRRGRAGEQPTLSPREKALQGLAELQKSGLPGRENAAEFLEKLSTVLREYLDGQFGLRAPELTTTELIAQVDESGILDRTDINALGGFLKQCDMVKFAAAGATGEQAGRALEMVRSFVDRTSAADSKNTAAENVNKAGEVKT